MLLELDECYSKSRIVDLVHRLFSDKCFFPGCARTYPTTYSYISIRIAPQAVLTRRLTRSCHALARPFESALSTKPLRRAYLHRGRYWFVVYAKWYLF